MSRSPRRRGLLAAAAAAAVAAGAGWSWWRSQEEAGAVFDWSLRAPTPAGGELVMAELRGRPLLINFWATWCPPCIRELPELERFFQAHRERVQLVGLAVDTLAPVQVFLKKQPLSFAIGLVGMEGIELARQLGNMAGVLPFTVLLDAQGELVKRKIGETSYAELETWIRRL